jgi:FecR protein
MPRFNPLPLLLMIFPLLAGCQQAKEPPAPAPQPVMPSGRIEAKLTYLDGEVSLTRERARLPAELDMVLWPGDTVETGKDAQAEVTFDDSSTINLDPETRYGITELAKDSASGQRTVRTNLMSGELKAQIAKLAQNSTFEIESPTSVAAVRGTEFIVACRPGQATEVTVLVGKVGVRRPRIKEAEVLLLEHHRLFIHPGRHLGRPFRLALGDEDLIRVKWQRWHERRIKVMERIRGRPKAFGPERPGLEKIKERREGRREKIAPQRKIAPEKRKAAIRKGGKAAPGKTGGAVKRTKSRRSG